MSKRNKRFKSTISLILLFLVVLAVAGSGMRLFRQRAAVPDTGRQPGIEQPVVDEEEYRIVIDQTHLIF